MIPRILHQVWVGGPIPEHLAAYRAQWLELHPDWEHVLWTEDNMPPLVNQALYDRAGAIAPQNVGQLRSDIARYEILLEHGGVYADLDMEPLRPIDPLLDVPAFVGWEVQGVWINNALMGSHAESAFLADLVRFLPENVARFAGSRPNVLSGPRYVTPIYRMHERMVVAHPQGAFYPYGFADVGTARERGPWSASTWAVHHWHNTRTNPRRRRSGSVQQFSTRRV